MLARTTLVAALLLVPAASAASWDATMIKASLEGATSMTTGYELQQTQSGKFYSLTARIASFDGDISVNFTSPANKRSTDEAALVVEYPTGWVATTERTVLRPRLQEETFGTTFSLGPLPATPPVNGAVVKAKVEKTTFTINLLPPNPVLLLDVPAEEGTAYLDVRNGEPLTVRTLYYGDGDKLVGPAILGSINLGIPTGTDIRPNAKFDLKTDKATCGSHDLVVRTRDGATTSTRDGTTMVSGVGIVRQVAVMRAPTLELPAGFVTDVVPAEFRLRCFPPSSLVEIAWAGAADGTFSSLGRFRVGPGGGLEDVVSFPADALDGLAEARVRASVVEGPRVLASAHYQANATAPVREAANADELALRAEVRLDRHLVDLGDDVGVEGMVKVAGKPAADVDVTLVWPFTDAASTRDDRYGFKVVRTGSDGKFKARFVGAPLGEGASVAYASVAGELDLQAQARKAGFATGFAKAPFVSTGVAPLALLDLKWRPEVPSAGQDVVLSGRLAPARSLASLPSGGIVEGARVELRAAFLASPMSGEAARDGTFSIPFRPPEGTAVAEYPLTILAWGPGPDRVGGVLAGRAFATPGMKVGALTASSVEKPQRASVAVDPTGTFPLAWVVRGSPTPTTTQPAPGSQILAADVLVVQPGGALTINLPDQEADLVLGAGTRATLAVHRFDGPTAHTILLVDTPGTISIAAPDSTGTAREIHVATRFHDIRLEGTHSNVDALPDGGVVVRVWEGTAEVSDRDGADAEVGPGKELRLAGDAAPDVSALSGLSEPDPFAKDSGKSTGQEGTITTPESEEGSPAAGIALVIGALGVAVLARRRR